MDKLLNILNVLVIISGIIFTISLVYVGYEYGIDGLYQATTPIRETFLIQ